MLGLTAVALSLFDTAHAQSPYAGSYAIIFSGDDWGHIAVTLDDPNTGNTGYGGGQLGGPFIVSVVLYTDGVISLHATGGDDFEGQIDGSGNITGTWTNPAGSSGTFTGALLNPTISPYAGTYSGTFSTGDSGTWQFGCDDSGRVTGNGRDSRYGSFCVSGYVSSNGVISLVYANSGAVFQGQIDGTGLVAGTWSNPTNGIPASFTGALVNPTISPYAGAYSGTFSGGDTGTWQFFCDASGTVTGNGDYDFMYNPFAASGYVSSSGVISMYSSSGAGFKGQIDGSGNATGTWSNPNHLSTGSFTGARYFSITTSSFLPAGRVASAYSQTLAASGGSTPYVWTIDSGSLPAGLSLNTSGVISGTPSVVTNANFTVWVSDNNGYASINEFSLTIVAETNKPTLTISAPVNNQLWSNAVFTVLGTAVDNVAVASVYIALSNAVVNTGFSLPATTNNWTNWNASLTLAAGTNTIFVYAVDTSGNISTTNKVNVNYVISAPLTGQMTGRGMVSPNYSNAVLQVGSNYTMTASVVAGSGFAFTNWTGGTNLPLTVLTNGTALQFVMRSNLVLQANFIDTNKPTLSITNLTSGQRWSNLVFTARGTATDNWQVASVQLRLNGGAWTNATGTTNWSAPATLIPGTNILAAYAVDNSGNVSATNSVNFQYVVTNQMQIRTTGLGTISPNYSNAWLEIGRNYSITSAPATGFVFTNWQFSTNWIGGATVTGTNLQFMMASNLTLLATFVETSRPTLLITAPTNNQRMTNALAYLTGTNSDNWGVSAVWYRLNSNTWNSVTATTNSYKNWSQMVTLRAGTNTVNAYAVNLGGNYSLTNSVSFVSSNTFALQLNFTNAQPVRTNGLVFNLQLSTGLNGHIQVSTNLIDWSNLTNFVGSNSAITFRDPAATNSIRRFYRAVIP